MKTLLIHDESEPPDKLREIVRGGSTEFCEADKLSDEAARDADRVVIWRQNEVEVRGSADRDRTDRLQWPQDEDKLRLLFNTGG
jgi:hypothetical protein